jgi:hypothetical protein
VRSVELGGVNESTDSGARVAVIDDRGVVHVTYTRSAPWRLDSGDLVVLLVGRTGGYRASRCWVLSDEDLEQAAGTAVKT